MQDEYALIADVYDHIGAYAARPDVDFYVEAAKRAGAPVLEVGCGTGRVLIPTVKSLPKKRPLPCRMVAGELVFVARKR